jgi:phosphatidylserine/phosphatidylglycerophosphate/cardiolipin synthase-like enzyme
MSVNDDIAKYFFTGTPGDATEPTPATFSDSQITPCIDMMEFMQSLQAALLEVGTSPDPAQNAGDFIYIAGFCFGLTASRFNHNRAFTPPSGSNTTGAFVRDMDPFHIDPASVASPDLLTQLKAKAQVGVDVRVMGWVAYSVLSTPPRIMPYYAQDYNDLLVAAAQRRDPYGLFSLNALTMKSIKVLREEPRLANRTMLNVLGHSAGAVHLRLIVIGKKNGPDGKCKAIGYTGGLDFIEDRWAAYGHVPQNWSIKQTMPRWHDIQAAVEGRAAQGAYDTFRAMWNEQIARKRVDFKFEGLTMYSHRDGMEAVPMRSPELPLLSGPTPTQHVQSLRTVPAFNYSWYNCLPEGQAASFAPQGIFELRAAWRKAIVAAEDYIYMEDECFWSREVMQWVKQAVQTHPDLKVILVMTSQTDPNDPRTDDTDLQNEAINVGLLGEGSNPLSETQRARIRAFRLWGEAVKVAPTFSIFGVIVDTPDQVLVSMQNNALLSGSEPIPADHYANKGLYLVQGNKSWRIIGNPEIKPGDLLEFRVSSPGSGVGADPNEFGVCDLVQIYGIAVHSKTTIIDDRWALIGSANCTRRSLFSDWEHSIAFVDDGTGVRDYRARLWAEHFKSANVADFNEMELALGAWEPDWNPMGDSPTKPVRAVGDGFFPYIESVPLPLPVKAMESQRRDFVDQILDLDARKPWGALCSPPSDE